MSCFKCPNCGTKSYIFGQGGAQRTAEEMDMKFLGEVSVVMMPVSYDDTYASISVHFLMYLDFAVYKTNKSFHGSLYV